MVPKYMTRLEKTSVCVSPTHCAFSDMMKILSILNYIKTSCYIDILFQMDDNTPDIRRDDHMWMLHSKCLPTWSERLELTPFALAETDSLQPPIPSQPTNSNEIFQQENGTDNKMRFSAASVLATALGLFSVATAHTIQLKAHSRECFHEVLHKDDLMTVTFQVGDREFGGSGNLEIDFWVRLSATYTDPWSCGLRWSRRADCCSEGKRANHKTIGSGATIEPRTY